MSSPTALPTAVDGPSLLLIAQDRAVEEIVRRALEHESTRFGFVHVADVSEARTYLTGHDPACLLFVLASDADDGLQAVRALRDLAPRPALVVLSERGEHDLALAALRAGAEDCLPIAHASPEVLGRVIRYSIERRRVQGQLIASREVQDAAFLRSPIGMALQSLDGRYLRVNPALARMLGRDVDGLLGTSCLDLTASEDRPAQLRLLDAFAAGERDASQGLERYAHRDGSWLSVLTSVALIRDAAGLPVSLFVQLQDITERVDAELATGRLAAIVESTRDAITATTLEGIITAWNPGAAVLYGYTAEEALGQDARRLVIPTELSSDVERILSEVRAGRAVGPVETRRRRRDGTVIDVSITSSPIRDESATIVGASVIARDISVEKAAQVRLEERERHFRAVFNSSIDAMFIADSRRRYIDANPAACELSGYSLAELRTMRIEDLAPEQDAAVVRASWPVFLQVGVSTGSFRLRRRDGTLRNLEYASTAHIVPHRHLSVKRDVTDRVQAAVAHQELEAQLQQARRLESVGQLAGGIAHDFNNLLSVILNYSHFVAARVQDDPELLADVGEMTAAAERAAALTRQLLVISRREAIHPQVVDLREVLWDTEHLLSRTLGENIRVVTDTCSQAALVWADRGQLDQVLMNLAVNARDAMPAGGELRLTVARDAVDAPTGPAGVVRLTVSDTGAGMSEEVRAHAFEPFFTTKPKGSGTGLGLATVYGIVAQSGGAVSVRSQPGRGAAVEVELPAHTTGPEREQCKPSPPSAPAAGQRILVVEDEREVRELTRRILADHGYQVFTARHGEEAFEICRDAELDLVLTDVVMPGLGGPELAVRVRQLRSGPPVVYMSGYSERGRELAEREHLLEKPFTAPALLAFVAAHVRGTATVGESGPAS